MANRLSLLNTIASPEQLRETPSARDGVPARLEFDMRDLGCELIQTAGILLRLPQVTMATAQVLFQKFFYVASVRKFSVRDIAMGSLFLGSKLEESTRKVRDIVNVTDQSIKIARRQPREPLQIFGTEYYSMQNGMTDAEFHILERLGFNVHLQLPYALMVNYLSALDLTDHLDVPQRAWGFLNDALRTNVYVCYQPPTIACAAIFLAARFAGIKLPTSPPWWEAFDADLEDLENIAGHILRLYARKRPLDIPISCEELEAYLRK